MTDYTDAAQVEALITSAIAHETSTPSLEDEQIEALVTIAMPDGVGTSATLQRAASAGWGWKAGITANQYDLKAASGASLTRSQWFEQCLKMAGAYASGALSVDGDTLGDNLVAMATAPAYLGESGDYGEWR